ncbi:tRNA (adenosine(37)-N6)-threonylcarbamoyltransferase complex ATPase subunit type 1 TsaE [Sphingomicrobium sp. XHP0239]|uniref:tRNA (adenosine(37)-N6)-threonylcarbamoyltransferase complex ATPase subunit type 1 TsaE n=1 Tax=Sphingomicrobium maritimum TaxID=3133972 RepID=UPI0031CC67B1
MILADAEATHQAGAQLAPYLRPGDVVTLSGPLGAGKTSFARGLLHAAGHEGEVPSPSFAIVQPYEHLDPPIFHVDLYRIEEEGELEQLALDDLADAVLIVEWPEKAARWDHALALTIAMDAPTGGRRLTVEAPTAWKSRCPFP